MEIVGTLKLAACETGQLDRGRWLNQTATSLFVGHRFIGGDIGRFCGIFHFGFDFFLSHVLGHFCRCRQWEVLVDFGIEEEWRDQPPCDQQCRDSDDYRSNCDVSFGEELHDGPNLLGWPETRCKAFAKGV
jgi:hypothetical protein